MKLSELKAKFDEIFEEHGDIEVVCSFAIPNEDFSVDDLEPYPEPYPINPKEVRLAWVDSKNKRITPRPVDPLTDQIVLSVLDG